MFSFVPSIWTEWEREKYILMLSNPLRLSATLSSSGCSKKRGDFPPCHRCFSSSGGWTVCCEYGLGNKACCWDGYSNSVRNQVPYLGNTVKKKNMRMTFSIEELGSCQVWAEVRCGLWRPVISDHRGRSWKTFNMNRNSRNKAWSGNFQGGSWIWGLERQVSVMWGKRPGRRLPRMSHLSCYLGFYLKLFFLFVCPCSALRNTLLGVSYKSSSGIWFTSETCSLCNIIYCWRLYSHMGKCMVTPHPPK